MVLSNDGRVAWVTARAEENCRKALAGAGASATIGTFVAWDIPRQRGLTTDDRFLYLTEFSSNTLSILPVRNLIDDVRPSDPYLGFGSPFGSFPDQGRPWR